MAGKVTLKEWVRWCTPEQVWGRAKSAFGEFEADDAILERIRGGFIRAGTHSWTMTRGSSPTETKTDLMLIPHHYWKDWIGDVPRLRKGDAIFMLTPRAYGGDFRRDPNIRLACLGIRFDPAQVDAHIPVQIRTEPEAPPQASDDLLPVLNKHPGGAPPKEFWTDLWIEVARRVHAGDIHPTSSNADVARQMQDWASSRGGLGETSAKNAARKLMAVLRREGVKN